MATEMRQTGGNWRKQGDEGFEEDSVDNRHLSKRILGSWKAVCRHNEKEIIEATVTNTFSREITFIFAIVNVATCKKEK